MPSMSCNMHSKQIVDEPFETLHIILGGHGERVSTGFVESTVNTVVGKRFGKRQQMRWSKRGAHLMLQTRTRALDGTLRAKFEQWHPALKPSSETEMAA